MLKDKLYPINKCSLTGLFGNLLEKINLQSTIEFHFLLTLRSFLSNHFLKTNSMKKITGLTFLFFFIFKAHSQITKGNCMVGGNGNFSSSHYRGDVTVNQNKTTIAVEPKIGYFIIDKFSTGLLLRYSNNRTESPGTPNSQQNVSSFGIGPYLRYYFLQSGQMANVFVETSYQYGTSKTNTGYGISNYKINSFSFSGGPVIYFNTTVGLEFTVGYLTSKYISYKDHSNHLQIGLGLQIHLENEE